MALNPSQHKAGCELVCVAHTCLSHEWVIIPVMHLEADLTREGFSDLRGSSIPLKL